MKNANILLIILVTFPIVLAFPAFGVQSLATPRIYLSPSENLFYTSQTQIGDKFNVTVWVQDAPDTGAWQVYMEFNDTILNVTRWIEPSSDPQYIFNGKTTTANPYPPSPDYIHLAAGLGRVEVAANLFPVPPTQPPSNGTGKLCIFEFIITAEPLVDEFLTSMLKIESQYTCLLNADGDEIPGVAKENGAYGFAYNVSPLPHLAVSPSFIEYRPYQNVSGEQFNVSLYANNINSSMYLKTVSLSLNYNQSLLSTESSNISLDSLWSGVNNVTVNGDLINITVTGPASTPVGNVFVGNISFTVLQQSTTPPRILGSYVSTNLEFVHQVLLNSSDGEISQALPIDGYVKIYAYVVEPPALVITEPTVTSGTDDVLSPSTEFSVDVVIGTTWQVKYIQLRMQYDPAILNWTGQVEGDALDIYGTFSATNFEGEKQARAGVIKINITLTTIPQTLAGSVAKLTFQCLSVGNCTVGLADTLVIDSTDNIIPVTYVQRDVTVVIPEFPLGYTLPILICLTLIAVALRRRLVHRTRPTIP